MAIENEAAQPAPDQSHWSGLQISRQSYPAKLLCIDDNPRFLATFSAVLQSVGYSVVTADNPFKGLSIAMSMSFDLAILDYHMPHMNGGQLAREIRRTRPSLPILLFSAYESVPMEDRKDVNEFVVKGENVALVLQKVRSLIAEKEVCRAAPEPSGTT
ncbi:MAG TPA: response regulator [Candidatus Angelobacter sp.]|nr:response regulator [Candidatus Angelobacter sp.]